MVLEAQWYESVLEASFAFGFLKISIALSLLRLNRGGKWYKWILWALIGKSASASIVIIPRIACVNRRTSRLHVLLHIICLHHLLDLLSAHLRGLGSNGQAEVLQEGAVPRLWSLQCR